MQMPLLRSLLAASPMLLFIGAGLAGPMGQPGGETVPQRVTQEALPPIVTVLGDEVRTDDAGELQRVVLAKLLDRYAREQGIDVADTEIDNYVDNLRRGMRASGLDAEDDLTREEVAQVTKMRRDMGRAMIRQWKLNRALYEQYGGRIIYQQLGPEPLDAYRRFLEEREAAGDFTLHDPAFKDTFWGYFTDEARHAFYASGSPEEAAAFKIPFWQGSAGGVEDGVPSAPSAGRGVTEAAEAPNDAPAGPLAGTNWRLVRFQSMDDAIGVIRPKDSSAYTMTLDADGSVRMQLNCNRAMGTWSAAPASNAISGTFRFGPLATTKALCPTPSMDERVARDAQWVRGYLLRDGMLHLSLMADAGIYSWEPVPADIVGGEFATEPDFEIEEALRAAVPDYAGRIVGNDGWARYVYGRMDLNADGRHEVLVLSMGPFFCGTGGCNLYLFTESEMGYVLISTFPRSRLPVVASPHKTAGWHDLIRRESGGGMPSAYIRHRFDGTRYGESERLPAEPTPVGTLLLNGDYSYAAGFPLPPRPE